MPRKELGKIRQSAVVMNYGPGAIIDFREPGTGASVSVVSAGLESWENQAASDGDASSNLRRFTEHRLKAKLKVDYFRLPPIAPDNKGDDRADPYITLLGVRFPKWLMCPTCNTLKPAQRWGEDPGNASRYCDKCSQNLPGNNKVYVIPTRFIVSCRNGHLDDFPWAEWVHHKNKAGCNNRREFRLENKGPGLAGLELFCPKCNARRSMDGIFRKEAFDNMSGCSGARPWLHGDNESCNSKPRAMQRGASNLYFPQMESALVIPPWSEDIVKSIGFRWEDLKNTETVEDRRKYIEKYLWDELDPKFKSRGIDDLLTAIENKLGISKNADTGNLRWDEYRQFLLCKTSGYQLKGDFEVRAEDVPNGLSHISQLLRIVSLKEVRALTSFTRVEPPPGHPTVKKQYLGRYPKRWLPAIEVKGEGIFISINEDRLKEWEKQKDVIDRVGGIRNLDESRVLNPDGRKDLPSITVGARFLLLHSLAHVLMKQLSLQCGYSTASLRERIYVGNDEYNMAGVLIYTATSDSDGTLGGLQREGKASHFKGLFTEAIRASEWCSSDPLCIKGLVAATESSSIAACHSCLLAPETSCEDYNRFLDRALIVGLPENRDIGFFHELIESKGDH